MYIDYIGDLQMFNNTTGDSANINFKTRNWSGKNAYEAEGWVKNKQGDIKYTLKGKWDSYLDAINVDTKEVISLWKANKLSDNHLEQFSFGEYTKQLNHIYHEILPRLPPTDSRFRTDQRAYEHGDRDLASSEKHRIEEKQRARRKELKEAGEVHTPRWFETTQDPISGETLYKYKGGYFEARQAKNFKNSLDLFT
jgi:hypothetical protein